VPTAPQARAPSAGEDTSVDLNAAKAPSLLRDLLSSPAECFARTPENEDRITVCEVTNAAMTDQGLFVAVSTVVIHD